MGYRDTESHEQTKPLGFSYTASKVFPATRVTVIKHCCFETAFPFVHLIKSQSTKQVHCASFYIYWPTIIAQENDTKVL